MSDQTTQAVSRLSPDDMEPGELCLDCGICCTNAVFSHLVVEEEDSARFRDHDRPDLAKLERINFACPLQEGAACGIYAYRPTICRSFECTSLARVRSGEISLEEAKPIVRKAVALYREVLDLKPDGLSYIEAEKAVAARKCPDEMNEAQFTRYGLALVTLESYLDRHIRHRGAEVIDRAM